MMHHRHRLFFKLGKRRNDLRQLHFELIADNEVNIGHATKRFQAGLGITPGNSDKGMWGMTEDLANDSSTIHLSPFRDRAGIDHKNIRFPAKLYRDKPALLKPVFQ